MDTYVYIPERMDHMREDRAAAWAIAHLLEDIGTDLRNGIRRARWTPRGAGKARLASPPPSAIRDVGRSTPTCRRCGGDAVYDPAAGDWVHVVRATDGAHRVDLWVAA